MADVSGLGERLRGSDRGQFMLVGALGLATLFVLLAVVLNTVVYTENLATRGGDVAGTQEALRYSHDAQGAVGALVVAVNDHNDTSVSDLRTAFRAGVRDWSDTTGGHYATSGTATSATLASTTYEVHATQTDGTRAFTNRTGDGNWTLATDVDETPTLELTVDEGSLVSVGGTGVATLVVTDGVNTWEVRFYSDAGTVRVDVRTAAGTTTCSLAATDVTVDVTDQQLSNGATTQSCAALDFTDDVSSPYTVTFQNGTAATGTYDFVGHGEAIDTTPENYASGGQPNATYSVSSATLRVAYEHGDLRYTSEYEVTEADAHA